MKLHSVLIPLSITSAVALAGWAVLDEPKFVEETAVAISIDPSAGFVGKKLPSVVVGESDIELDPETGFALAAFPPTIPDRGEWHREAWFVNDCLDCHETGVQGAPQIRHTGLPEIALQSKCRTCHVLIPGNIEFTPDAKDLEFASWAFPPMMPNNYKHIQAWGERNCMMCHEDGTLGAPVVKHDGLPEITLIAKCRTCHVQVRSHMSSPWAESRFETLND